MTTSEPMSNPRNENEYEVYMRTTELRSLQGRTEEFVHRDELLFRTAHMATELLLRHAAEDIDQATAAIRASSLDPATTLVERAALDIELTIRLLDPLRRIAPSDFQIIRTALGNGSGFGSPGWRDVRVSCKALGKAFDDFVAHHQVDLVALYHRQDDADFRVYRLCEAMIELDEQISTWRIRHYNLAVRMIGNGSKGTQGTPVNALARLIDVREFPYLWNVRSVLTETGPLGDATR